MEREVKQLSLQDRDRRVIWHPDTQAQTEPPPIAITEGKGALLMDENGSAYVDGISSWWVNIHGHGHPYIAQKIAEQASRLEHCIFAGLTHPPAIELAERLLEILPSCPADPRANQAKIFFSDNGSTAVEVALKMAIQYWRNQGIEKKKILAFRHGYHGDTFGAMSVSARSAFTRPFEDYLFEVDYVDIPVSDGVGAGIVNIPSRPAALLPDDSYFDGIADKLETGQYAAFIFEPLILGAGGMRMYTAPALDKLIELCRAHQLLIISDEVMTGFGRTGKPFAMEYAQSRADIICLSKGLTGGTMALGITSCVQKVYDAFLSNDPAKAFLHGHSFTANPIACAAALASLDLFVKTSCGEDIDRVVRKQTDFLRQIQDQPMIKNPRQTGTILAFDVITKEQDGYMNSMRGFLSDFFISRKIILRPLGNTVYILPPYCITNEQLDAIYDVVIAMIDQLSSSEALQRG